MPKIKRQLFESIFHVDLTAVRLLLGLSELGWCVGLLWAGDTFARPTYSIMRLYAIEEIWAIIFGAMAIVQFHIMLKHDYHSRFAIGFAGINATFTIFYMLAMLLAVSPIPVAVVGSMPLALGASWIFIQSGTANFVRWEHRHDGHITG